MLDKTPNLWYNNWVGLTGVGPQKERLEMKAVTTIKVRKATHTGISEYEVKLSGNAPLIMDGEKVTRTCTGGTPHRKGVLVEIDCVAYLG